MIKGFSSVTNAIVLEAAKIARDMGHGIIASEHMLLALLAGVEGDQSPTVTQQVLIPFVSPADMHETTKDRYGKHEPSEITHVLGTTLQLQRIMERTHSFRDRLEPEVQPHHVLLALLTSNDKACTSLIEASGHSTDFFVERVTQIRYGSLIACTPHNVSVMTTDASKGHLVVIDGFQDRTAAQAAANAILTKVV